MLVKLINNPTLEFIDSGVGRCWNKGSYGVDNKKGLERIERVCNKNQHSSMLRFTNYIFDIEISTSVLLELSRHQVGVNLAMQSTRYTIKNDLKNMGFKMSNNDKVNQLLSDYMMDIVFLIENNPTIANDDLKLLLPQSFVYKGQIQFNGQSLQHFLKLRTAKSSHYHIRDFAYALFENTPEEHKFLFKEFVND